jgi:FkbM family methyltransferase
MSETSRMRLASFFHLPAVAAFRLRRRLRPTERERSYFRYLAAGGVETFRYDHRLAPGATILDLGGYQGEWTRGMLERFDCRAFVFEPVRSYADALERAFAGERVVVCPFGLGDRTRSETIVLADDASSIFGRGQTEERILIKDVAEWWQDAQPGRVAVAKINIEGGEYEVLPRLIETGLIREIDEVQVQFHDFVEDAPRRMDAILTSLALTHEPTWQFRFIWENWRRAGAVSGPPK